MDIWVYSLPDHNNIRQRLLEAIENDTHGHPIRIEEQKKYGASEELEKTDYFSRPGTNPKDYYYKILLPSFRTYIRKVLDRYIQQEIKLQNVWYQQYVTRDKHGWHVHPDCNISWVYYIEMENSKDSTEFYDIIEGKRFQMDVKEGDIITFPSYMIHRSPPTTANRKTVIAGNFNFTIVKLKFQEEEI